jgi:hypothetical protein
MIITPTNLTGGVVTIGSLALIGYVSINAAKFGVVVGSAYMLGGVIALLFGIRGIISQQSARNRRYR